MGKERTSMKHRIEPERSRNRNLEDRTKDSHNSVKRSKYSMEHEAKKERNCRVSDRTASREGHRRSEDPHCSKKDQSGRKRRSSSKERRSDCSPKMSKYSRDERRSLRVSRSRDLKKDESVTKRGRDDRAVRDRSSRRKSRENQKNKSSRSKSRRRSRSRSRSRSRRGDLAASAPRLRKHTSRHTWIQSMNGATSRRRYGRFKGHRRVDRLKSHPSFAKSPRSKCSSERESARSPASCITVSDEPYADSPRSPSPRSERSPFSWRHPECRRCDTSHIRRCSHFSPRRSRTFSNSSRKSNRSRSSRVRSLQLNGSDDPSGSIREDRHCDIVDHQRPEVYLRTANLIPYDSNVMAPTNNPPAIYEDWASYINAEGNTYFYNQRTGISQWKTPAGFDVHHPCSRVFKYDKASMRFFMVRQSGAIYEPPAHIQSPDLTLQAYEAERTRQDVAKEKQRKYAELMEKFSDPRNQVPLALKDSLQYLSEPLAVVHKSTTAMETRIAEITQANSLDLLTTAADWNSNLMLNRSIIFQPISKENNKALNSPYQMDCLLASTQPTLLEYEAERCAKQVGSLKLEYANAALAYNDLKSQLIVFFRDSNDHVLDVNRHLVEVRRSIKNLMEMPAINGCPLMF